MCIWYIFCFVFLIILKINCNSYNNEMWIIKCMFYNNLYTIPAEHRNLHLFYERFNIFFFVHLRLQIMILSHRLKVTFLMYWCYWLIWSQFLLKDTRIFFFSQHIKTTQHICYTIHNCNGMINPMLIVISFTFNRFKYWSPSPDFRYVFTTRQFNSPF